MHLPSDDIDTVIPMEKTKGLRPGIQLSRGWNLDWDEPRPKANNNSDLFFL